MHNINLHTMRAGGRLEPFLAIIDSVLQAYLPSVTETLGVVDVDIVIMDDASRAIPETGVGGWAHHQHLMSVYVNPEFPNLLSHFDFELKSTLAHELNHVTRWQKVGYKYTLLESTIAEGLADHFDIAVNGSEPRPWDIALTEEQLTDYLAQAQLIWNDTDYNHAEWFFGTGTIPRWTGYSLGFKLVGDYMKRSGVADPKQLVGLPTETFIK